SAAAVIQPAVPPPTITMRRLPDTLMSIFRSTRSRRRRSTAGTASDHWPRSGAGAGGGGGGGGAGHAAVARITDPSAQVCVAGGAGGGGGGGGGGAGGGAACRPPNLYVAPSIQRRP